MKKSELLAIEPIKADHLMIANAKALKPQKQSWSSHAKFETLVYAAAKTNVQILHIALFSTETLRLGCEMPRYDVFIDKQKEQWLSYDRLNNRWRTAMIMNLFSGDFYLLFKEIDTGFAKEAICNFFGDSSDPIRTVDNWQRQIMEKRKKERYVRETQEWTKKMSLIGPEPTDFQRWIDKHATHEKFVFYQYRKNGPITGRCSYCEHTVTLRSPKHNGYGKCPHCKERVQFKAVGKAGTIVTPKKWAYLFQPYEKGVVLREYWCYKKFAKGAYDNPDILLSEVRRVIFNEDLRCEAYYFDLYKQCFMTWIKDSGVRNGSWWGSREYDGCVYSRNMKKIASIIPRTGIAEMVKSQTAFDPETYLNMLKIRPILEQYAKAGLTRLAMESLERKWTDERKTESQPVFAKTGLLWRNLQIDKSRLDRLRKANGGKEFLNWLRYEKERGEIIPDFVIGWYVENKIKPGDIEFISDRMSAEQVKNYLEKQQRVCGESINQLLTMWHDYLRMASRANYDTTDSIIYRCRWLKKRHDELVDKLGSKTNALRAGEIIEKYPDVDRLLGEYQSKYSFCGNQFSILIPQKIEDVLSEGDALHHCIASTDRYFERIQQHETFLAFLRKTDDPDTPWYTLEVEPNGTIRQKRTLYNRQNDDLKEAEPFLKKWQKEIQAKLTDEDLAFASESRSKRIKEFMELRAQGTKVNNGQVAGMLLADVLEKDLMEVGA